VTTAVNAVCVDSRVHADVGFPPCGANADEPSNIARAAASNQTIARAAASHQTLREQHAQKNNVVKNTSDLGGLGSLLRHAEF